MHFYDVEEYGGVCEDQNNVKEKSPSERVYSRLGSWWEIIPIDSAASRVVAVPVLMFFLEKGLSIHVFVLLGHFSGERDRKQRVKTGMKQRCSICSQGCTVLVLMVLKTLSITRQTDRLSNPLLRMEDDKVVVQGDTVEEKLSAPTGVANKARQFFNKKNRSQMTWTSWSTQFLLPSASTPFRSCRKLAPSGNKVIQIGENNVQQTVQVEAEVKKKRISDTSVCEYQVGWVCKRLEKRYLTQLHIS